MSKQKNKKWYLVLMVALLSVFLFGCENTTPVESIGFVLGANEQIALLVGQEMNLESIVDIRPSYATNKSYSVTSSREDVISIDGTNMIAVAEGTATIKIVSKDNDKKEDMMTVVVKNSIEKLATPRNVQYDSTNQTIRYEAVNNASGYVVSVSDGSTTQEFDVGGDRFDLRRYSLDMFDKKLSVSVRAVPARYGYAYQESDFSQEYKFYQTAPVNSFEIKGGVLSYDVNADKVNIYFDNTLFASTTDREMSLENLDEALAGKKIKVKLEALVKDEVKQSLGSDVKYFDSVMIEKDLQVLDRVDATIVSTTLSWNHVPYSKGYRIYIDGINILNGETIDQDSSDNGIYIANSLNLENLNEFESIITEDDIANIIIKPVITNESVNVASTNSVDTIQVSRLDTPVFTLIGNRLTWSAVDYASTYTFGLVNGAETVKATVIDNEYVFENNLDATSFDISVRADSSGENLGVYYIYSKEAQITITKHQSPELSINNYKLSFDTVAGEEYKISFKINDTDGNEELIYVGTGERFELDLDYRFSAETHQITCLRLGNNRDSIDGVPSYESFVQLEKINEINIVNGVARVNRSSKNALATIKLVTIVGGEEYENTDLEWRYNTLDESSLPYFNAGNYETKVYVLGDGSETFSYRESILFEMQEVACATVGFTVLDNPEFDPNSFAKENGQISFSEIAGASYRIQKFVSGNWVNGNTLNTTTYTPSLNSGESITVRLQSVGNNGNILDSKYSSAITIKKLSTPSIAYNNQTNEFTVSADEDAFESLIEFNGNQVDLEEIELQVGNNVISIHSIAGDRIDTNYYVNSDISSITVNKLDESSTFKVKSNQLIIESEHGREYDILVKFTFDGTDYLFKTENGLLVCDGFDPLPYQYRSGAYYIDVLNADNELIVEEMLTSFGVAVKYLAPVGDNTIATSEMSESVFKILEFLNKPVLTRIDQIIEFANQNEFSYSNYNIVVNGIRSIAMDNLIANIETTASGSKVVIDALKLLDVLGGGVHSIQIQVNDLADDNALLTMYSESMQIARANQVGISYSKNNAQQDNSGYITFTRDDESYSRSYEIVVGGIEYRLTDDDFVDSKYTLRLDDLSLDSGDVVISAKVKTTDSSSICMFNSKLSSAEITKISSPNNIYISEDVLHFDSVSGAVKYEIYSQRVIGGTLEFIRTQTETALTLDINPEDNKYIIIKAISNESASNASYSEPIVLNKANKPTADVGYYGNLIISNLPKYNETNVIVYVSNLTFGKEIEINLSSIDTSKAMLVGDDLIIYAEQLLSYPTNTLSPQDIAINVDILYPGSIESREYYLNPDELRVNTYGLLAPINVKKTTENVDYFDWEANPINKIGSSPVEEDYIFHIKYTSTNGDVCEAVSTDEKLVYLDGGVYKSYGIIQVAKAKIPYGYDNDGDGEVDVVFGTGSYEIKVKSIATINVDEYEICTSPYSSVYSFSVMPAPSISAYNGKIEWDTCEGATEYELTITQNTVEIVDRVRTNSYEFQNAAFNDVSGLFNVKVKAISSNINVVDSVYSESITVYRLAKVSEARIDDGMLTFVADKYFNRAIITMTNLNTEDSITIPIDIDNLDNARSELAKLGKISWDEVDDSLFGTRRYIISNDILKTTGGVGYSITIKLYGESSKLGTVEISEDESLDLTELMMINSADSTNFNMDTYRLATSSYNVQSGVLEFGGNYDVKLNYNFNSTATVHDFWKNTYIFKILLTTDEGTKDIYAVDYDRFVEYKDSLDSSDYIIHEDFDLRPTKNSLYATVIFRNESQDLYFNVYYNNRIDVGSFDEIYYSEINQIVGEETITYTSDSNIKEIDISSGRPFYFTVCILGGDSYNVEVSNGQSGTITKNIGYLTSIVTDIKPFIKYGENYLAIVSGKVQIINMVQTKDGEIIDYPAYRLHIQSTDGKIDQLVYVYAYKETFTETYALTVARNIAIKNEGSADGIILVVIPYSEVGEFVIYDMAQHFPCGKSYNVSIRTMAGIGDGGTADGNYLLNAKTDSADYLYYKYVDTSAVVNDNGLLEFAQSYAEINSEKIYANKYEITIVDQAGEYIYEIIKGENNVNVEFDEDNKKVLYNLPTTYCEGNYSIWIKAMSNDERIINASYAGVCKFSRISKPTEVKIENGKLVWGLSSTTDYEKITIKINYTDKVDGEDIQREIVFNKSGSDYNGNSNYKYYAFEDGTYTDRLSGDNVYLHGGNYKITVAVVAKPGLNMINSGYVDVLNVDRLKEITTSTIRSDDGVLTWENITGANKYEVIIIQGMTSYKYTVEENLLDLTATEDDNGNILPAGEGYKVNVRAIGSDKITGMARNTRDGFTKLAKVEKIQVSEDFKIIWSPVEGTSYYYVGFDYDVAEGYEYYEIIEDNQSLVEVDGEEKLMCSITAPAGISGIFTVYVRAVVCDEDYLFSGDYSSYTTTVNIPNGIVETIGFDSSINSLTWRINREGDLYIETDIFNIVYKINKSTSEGIIEENVLIKINKIDNSEFFVEKDEELYCVYPLYQMGVYSGIEVYVTRMGTIESSHTVYSNEDTNNTIVLDQFKYGDGEEATPYGIESYEQLLNIKQFALRTKHFKLTSSITISNENVSTLLDDNYDENTKLTGLISSSFNGVFDGDGYNIDTEEGYPIEITNEKQFALFGKLNNATVKNIVLNVQIKSSYDENLSNSFANGDENVVQLSLIATGANNSTIRNIVLSKLDIIVEGKISNIGINVAGLIVGDNNSTISSDELNLEDDFTPTVNVQINARLNNVESRIAGLVAIAKGTHIEEQELSYTMENSFADNSFTYVGGLVADYTGNTSQNTGVVNSKVAINIDNIKNNIKIRYIGGIVASSKLMLIQNNIVSGQVKNSNLNTNCMIGGVVGYADGVVVKNNTINIDFKNLIIENYNSQDIGLIVGSVTANTKACVFENNTSQASGQTSIIKEDGWKITLGEYGSKANLVGDIN